MVRRSGKTEWMLQQLLESVLEGQPYSKVVGYSKQYSQQLKQRFLEMLHKTDLEVRYYSNKIEAEGSIIEFSGPLKDYEKVGDYRSGYFYDHFGDIDK